LAPLAARRHPPLPARLAPNLVPCGLPDICEGSLIDHTPSSSSQRLESPQAVYEDLCKSLIGVGFEISCSTIAKFMDVVQFKVPQSATSNKTRRSKQSRLHSFIIGHQISDKGEKSLHFLSSLLDIVLLKKDMEKRVSLAEPLFKLLGELLTSEWFQGHIDEDEKQKDALAHICETVSQSVLYVQQTTLHILRDIATSVLSNLPLANDSHSQSVLEELISTLVPCWQSTTSNLKDLLQVFVDALPDVPENRRLALMVYLLRKLVESGDNSDHLQGTLGELLEKVILQLRTIDSKGKQSCIHRSVRKQLKEHMLRVLRNTTKRMVPSEFFKAIGQLVAYGEGSVKKKALRLLCQNVKDYTMVEKKHRVGRKDGQSFTNSYLVMDESVMESLRELSSRIIQLVDGPVDSCPVPLQLAAVSSLEVLAKKLPNSNHVSPSCLTVVTRHITSDNITLSSSCLRSAGALMSVLGPKALSVLPYLMRQILERAHDVSSCPTVVFNPMKARMLQVLASGKASILLSILLVLEEVVEHLGCFLNPYLEFILDLLLLHSEYASASDQKLKSRATLLRKLVPEKIHVRLLLSPLMKIYEEALKCGETSISLVFEMLANMVSSMDKPSIRSYHAKIYEHCLVALDLRRQHPEMVKNIGVIEDHVIHAIIVLTMKLTESMFRPLFIHSLEWADSQSEDHDSNGVLCRKISFYKLVNELTEQHRSLFVPYFKYLIEGCIHHLTDDQDVQRTGLAKKRKKSKGGDECSAVRGMLSSEQWHLRALILMSLYKCFLYDTGNLRFLESSNFQLVGLFLILAILFQVLLKPVVSQLAVEPPASLEQFFDLPTIDGINESLVCCLGQMAVTVGSDDIWKQLNHEVLMQTRSEKVRPRILGLRVVKYLVEHLKEEYLVCLPETIPFLSELLEDVEPSVKSLSQEVLRELESLSGESLQQYL
ncbi:hypothetical protein Taro_038028, partial [Colocasia esculenta]|nr:hypothetical protein [Colocasia esculenta]